MERAFYHRPWFAGEGKIRKFFWIAGRSPGLSGFRGAGFPHFLFPQGFQFPAFALVSPVGRELVSR
jgi:hypothetical protein